jgi:hypothetical protein
MNKEFVPYELAVKLKQLGFEDECMAYYEISVTEVEHEEDGTSGPFGWKQGEVSFEKRFFVNNIKGVDHTNDNWVCAAAPTWRSAFKWFREKSFYVNINYDWNDEVFRITIMKQDKDKSCKIIHLKEDDYIKEFYTYEEAELACLDKLIEIVESKNK